MKAFLIPSLMILSATSAHAITCIPLGPSDDFTRVSETELQAKDRYGAKYKVTVDECPALMAGDPIVMESSFDELCEGEVLQVGQDFCTVDLIERLSR